MTQTRRPRLSRMVFSAALAAGLAVLGLGLSTGTAQAGGYHQPYKPAPKVYYKAPVVVYQPKVVYEPRVVYQPVKKYTYVPAPQPRYVKKHHAPQYYAPQSAHVGYGYKY